MSAPQVVEVPQFPGSIEEYVALRDELARTPQGGAVMMIVALNIYAADPELGWPCLTIAIDRGLLQEGAGGYKGWEIIVPERRRIASQIKGREYLPRSYVLGASPENGYRLSSPPYRFQVSDNPYSGSIESGSYKVFVSCSGAASPRPVLLKRNDQGLWKAYEWSSLLLGVMKPTSSQVDDL